MSSAEGAPAVGHTPGPWKAVCDSLKPMVTTKEGWQIAYLRSCEAVEANARLIAASPDLAAALMALVEQVESGAFDHIAADHPDSAVIAARAALRKAGL